MEERIAEMKKQIGLWALILFFCFEHLKAQVSVTTWHNDNGRTGENISETHLNTGSFAHRGFGRLCEVPLPSSPQQEQVYAQPLVVANSDGSMNVYVATMQDNVYVFSVPATANWTTQTCTQLQSTAPVSLLRGGLAGQYPADACFIGKGFSGSDCSTRAICPSVGVLGTPVIDSTSNTMYLVTESQDTYTGQQGVNCTKTPPKTWYHYLHALDLTSSTLAEKTVVLSKLLHPNQARPRFNRSNFCSARVYYFFRRGPLLLRLRRPSMLLSL
jgi:hypothetical protein